MHCSADLSCFALTTQPPTYCPCFPGTPSCTAFDRNGDSTVSRSEFRAALPLLGFDVSDGPALDTVFDDLDVDGSGVIEYAELSALLKRDDIELSGKLRDGAVAFDTDSKNRIALRRDESLDADDEPRPNLGAARLVTSDALPDVFTSRAPPRSKAPGTRRPSIG